MWLFKGNKFSVFLNVGVADELYYTDQITRGDAKSIRKYHLATLTWEVIQYENGKATGPVLIGPFFKIRLSIVLPKATVVGSGCSD